MPLLVLEEREEGLRLRRARLEDYRVALEALLLLLEPGETTTYGELAKLLGVSPRLVGRLLKENKRPAVVPCHRVVGSKSLGGYSRGGPAVKDKLLRLESGGASKLRRLSEELL